MAPASCAPFGAKTTTPTWAASPQQASGQANDTLCGTFDALPVADTLLYTFTSATPDGSCQVLGAQLTCGEGNRAFQHDQRSGRTLIPEIPVLRWGQCRLMASHGRNPPDATDSPEAIPLVSYSEVGKYV
ncbi:hypothetical protein B0H66DRAFT_644119 [Apodospora peruviana]|uniref:Uncharacterized protein n=1 Tax=Apodospora peruviana TaxID=516989 RepID=A0AAE0LZ22_9PEZI|nr:hypothetical protein B0H66DRAFT_644119 [Apodospora peruviana]